MKYGKKKMKVEYLAVESKGRMVVSNKHVMNGQLLFINPDDVQWYYVDENNYSESRRIKVGTEIEFDGGIHPAVRSLHNVTILN